MRSKFAVWVLLAPCGLLAAESGEKLFETHCAPCHGAKGEGGRGANLAVRKLPRAPDDAALAAIIANGIPGTQMPGTRMTAEESTQLVRFVRGLGKVQSAQVPGDRADGERLFWSKGNCGQCHTVGPRGGHMGPDLTDVGAYRGTAYLRTSILEPEADIPENFASYRKVIYMPDNYLRVHAATVDGKEVTGARVDEDTFTIQIRDDHDRLYSFRKDELRELRKEWGKSPMPSYKGVFSEVELQDLVAYLASLQGAL
jgi:cytochrome c oxidase cbb3-type subunit III